MIRTLVARLVAGSLLALLATTPALAQSGDGSLRGYVKDEQGGVLPGVTVTAASPALLTPVVAVTDSDGYYRLLNLPPGTYTITAEIAGFATYRREGILTRAGSTFSVDIAMKLGSLTETVTVSGESPMIETSSPSSTLTIQGDLLRAAPVTSRRLFSDVLDMTPGVNSRNVNDGLGRRAYYFHGTHIYAHAIQLEGAPASAYTDSAAHSMNMGGDVVQDVELKLGGVDAASPLGTGVVMNIVTPRGGNRFKGSADYSYQPLSWNSDNTRGGRTPGGLPTAQAVKQGDLSLGGPVVKDKVWFFSAYRYADLVNGISRTDQDLAFLQAFKPDFQPFDNTLKSHQPFVKVTTQVSAKHELSGFYQYDRNHTTRGRERDTSQVEFASVGGPLLQGKLTSVWTNRLTSQVSAAYSAKGGSTESSYEKTLQRGFGPQVYVHQSTFLSSGLPTGTGRLVQMNNVQSFSLLPSSMLILRGDLTYFREGRGGSHELKTGIWAAPRLWRDVTTRYLNGGFVLEEVRQIDPNNAGAGTVPFHREYRTPTAAQTTAARDRDVGIYVQDAWRPGPRVTANMGVRVDLIRRHDALFNVDRMKSVEVGPRLGLSYLVTQDARNVLRASYGRIHEQVNGRDPITQFASGLPRGALIRDLYDTTGTGLFETEILTPAATAALSGLEFDPRQHQPFVDEFIVGFRRQFRGQVSLDVTGTRRYHQDGYALVDINGIYPDGPYKPFGGFGKVDPNRGIIYHQRNATWERVVLTVLEGVLAKNLSNNFQAVLSVTRQWQHLDGTWNPTDPARFIQPNAFPNNRELSPYLFGNGEHNTLNGGGSESGVAYRPYSIRFASEYVAPWGIRLGTSYVIQAGGWVGQVVTRIPAPDPIFGPATVRLANGQRQPNPLATTIRFAYPTRSEGQTLNEPVRYLQLQVGREFTVGHQRIDSTLGIFNVFNTGAHTQWIDTGGANQLYSTNYLQPFNRHPPRQFQLTVAYRF
jgi:hypothetical protein